MKEALKSVTATDLKNRLGDYLGEVIHRKEPLMIERHGKPVAVIVDLEQWKTLRPVQEGKTGDHPWIVAAKRLADKIDKKHPVMKPFSAVELIRQIRDEREGEG